MDDSEKLAMLKSILNPMDCVALPSDAVLTVYLTASGREIISWRYSYHSASAEIETVPTEYEMTQIYSVVAGFGISGAENQTAHSENGISRTFKYEDMISYIRNHVVPFVGAL